MTLLLLITVMMHALAAPRDFVVPTHPPWNAPAEADLEPPAKREEPPAKRERLG